MPNSVLLLYREAQRLPPYRDAAIAGGLEPCIVEAGSSYSMDHVHGLLLMGGIDVNPAAYGEERGPNTDEPDPALDNAETDAIEVALRQDMPILAICRGMQLLNVHHGGTLFQHLTPVDRHRAIPEDDRSLPVHSVHIEEGSLLARVMESDTCKVNSRHHQAAKRVGEGLRVSGTAPDGVIEGLERSDRTFVLGVQWHPEDQIRRDAAQLRLFQRLREAMGR